jgi:hypothetical protein
MLSYPPPGLAFGEPDDRLQRVSSTPRLFGSVTDVSGILDRQPSRTMMAGCVFAIPRRDAPELCMNDPPRNREGAGNAGCTLHSRSRVQVAQRNTHTSIQVQRRQSGIPCAMALRLMPRSPRRRIRLVTVAAGLMASLIRLDRCRHRQLSTSNGCRDHTVLPYPTSAVRPARCCSLTETAL